MAKQTKTQAKRSLRMIRSKLIILWNNGHISTNDFVKINDITNRNQKRLGL